MTINKTIAGILIGISKLENPRESLLTSKYPLEELRSDIDELIEKLEDGEDHIQDILGKLNDSLTEIKEAEETALLILPQINNIKL